MPSARTCINLDQIPPELKEYHGPGKNTLNILFAIGGGTSWLIWGTRKRCALSDLGLPSMAARLAIAAETTGLLDSTIIITDPEQADVIELDKRVKSEDASIYPNLSRLATCAAIIPKQN